MLARWHMAAICNRVMDGDGVMGQSNLRGLSPGRGDVQQSVSFETLFGPDMFIRSENYVGLFLSIYSVR
jgi:hypothetical protein